MRLFQPWWSCRLRVFHKAYVSAKAAKLQSVHKWLKISSILFISSLVNSNVMRVVPLGTGGERKSMMFRESIISTSWFFGQRNLPPSTRCMNETWMIFASFFVTIPGYHESLYATATYWSTLTTLRACVPSLRQNVVFVEEAVVVLASM